MVAGFFRSLFSGRKASSEKLRMLDDEMGEQLRAHFEKIQYPVELVATLDDQRFSREMRRLLEEISMLSEKVSVRFDGQGQRVPSFLLSLAGEEARLCFAGSPMGHELTSLVLAMLQTGGHPPKVEEALLERIRKIDTSCHFETYITMSCHNCPDVVQALNLMAIVNPGIRHVVIDGNIFMREVERLGLEGVPSIRLNGKAFDQGRKTLEELLDLLDAHPGG